MGFVDSRKMKLLILTALALGLYASWMVGVKVSTDL